MITKNNESAVLTLICIQLFDLFDIREGAGNDPYLLMAGFPPAQLTDSSLTIEAAGLKGSQVTQKKC